MNNSYFSGLSKKKKKKRKKYKKKCIYVKSVSHDIDKK